MCKPNCLKDSQCSGEKCRFGECQSPCSIDNDCQEKERCLSGHCSSACHTNKDCGSISHFCVDGVCQDTCASDNHCPEGSKCFRKSCVTTCGGDTGMSSWEQTKEKLNLFPSPV